MTTRDIVELIISKDNTVTKSNALIEAKYTSESATELKLIQTVFSNIQPGDFSTHTYVFPIKQFLDLLELKGNSGYAELKNITLNLFKKPVSITIDGKTSQLTWFTFVEYNDRKGTITIEIHRFWEQYLLALSSNFTSYKLFNITKLKSIYSLRLYELLKSRVNLNPTRVISIQELREKLGIDEKQYPRYANLKQRVIVPAQEELLKESDIYFEFNEIKKGRAVDSLEFQIHRNNNQAQENLKIGVVLKGSELEGFGLTAKAIDSILDKYPAERIQANVAYTKGRMDLGKVGDPAAYLVTAIEKDYAASSSNIPNNDESLPGSDTSEDEGRLIVPFYNWLEDRE